MPFNIRTIFLMLRGVDQTGRAMDSATKKVETLEEKEKMLAQTSYRLLFAGVAFVAFGAMMLGALGSMIGSSSRGQMVMDAFGEAIDRVKRSFSEATLNLFGEQIKDVTKSINELSQDKDTMELLTAVSWGIGFTIVGAGLLFATSSAGTYLINQALKFWGLEGLEGANLVTVGGVAGGLFGVGTAIAISVGGVLTVDWILQNVFGKTKQESHELVKGGFQMTLPGGAVADTAQGIKSLQKGDIWGALFGSGGSLTDRLSALDKTGREAVSNITITIGNVITNTDATNFGTSIVDEIRANQGH
jgi:hypothetical protein